MHDVVEDTSVTLDELRAAGLSPEAAATVDAVTHRTGETRERYLDRILATPGAPTLKRADVASNTRPERVALLPDDEQEWFATKYAYVRERLSEAGD